MAMGDILAGTGAPADARVDADAIPNLFGAGEESDHNLGTPSSLASSRTAKDRQEVP